MTVFVMRGLVPRIPLRKAPCPMNRDGRDKPGHDEPDGARYYPADPFRSPLQPAGDAWPTSRTKWPATTRAGPTRWATWSRSLCPPMRKRSPWPRKPPTSSAFPARPTSSSTRTRRANGTRKPHSAPIVPTPTSRIAKADRPAASPRQSQGAKHAYFRDRRGDPRARHRARRRPGNDGRQTASARRPEGRSEQGSKAQGRRESVQRRAGEDPRTQRALRSVEDRALASEAAPSPRLLRAHDGAHVGIDFRDRRQDFVEKVLADQRVAEREIIDAGEKKAVHGVARRLDHGLALDVERGVEQHRHAGERLEFLQQPPQPRVGIA